MIIRAIENHLKKAAKSYPVVTLVGPRQSGKTSLVKKVFADKIYFNLEQPDLRLAASEDPKHFLSQLPDGAVLDEIQNVPELLSYIQVIVDEKQREGLFILTGSHQLSLHQAITQSLAGRTAMLQLLPLSVDELVSAKLAPQTIDLQTFMGFYPRIFDKDIEPTMMYRDYFRTYIERDVRQLINLKDLRKFQNFLRLLARRTGQLLNLSALGNECGVSHNTVREWLSILEASFLVYRLEPYHANINKRVVKTPKYYFVDCGLACYLLGIETVEQLMRDPLRGALIETMVVMDVVKMRLNSNRSPGLYFYRDNQGNEVDLILQQGQHLTPVEIKASQTYQTQFNKGVDYFRALLPKQVREGYIAYSGDHHQRIGDNYLLNYQQLSQALDTNAQSDE